MGSGDPFPRSLSARRHYQSPVRTTTMSNTKEKLPNYTIRTMEKEEREEAFRMIDKEGWNSTLGKFTILHRDYPDHFFVAVTDQKEVLGTVSLIPTFEGEYLLGNVVVKEGYRCKGIGKRLILYLLTKYSDSVISLTSVPTTDEFYRKLGLKLIEPQDGHDIFYIVPDLDIMEKMISPQTKDITVSSYKENDEETFKKLDAYESEARGYKNTKYLLAMMKCFNLLIATNSEEEVVGFICYFMKNDGIILDGLFVDSEEIATILMREVVVKCPEAKNIKLQTHMTNQFLPKLGHVTESHSYNRFYFGPRQPTPPRVTKVYNVSDCGCTY